jgi:hypothetical protein
MNRKIELGEAVSAGSNVGIVLHRSSTQRDRMQLSDAEAIELRDALLERYPLPVQPSALQRLEEWQKDAPQTRAYSVQAGKNVYVVWLYVNGYRIGKSIAGTIADAINAALDEAEGGE